MIAHLQEAQKAVASAFVVVGLAAKKKRKRPVHKPPAARGAPRGTSAGSTSKKVLQFDMVLLFAMALLLACIWVMS